MLRIVVLGGLALSSAAVTVPCDILVAGGSLSSLAAAITAANSTTATVCFTDPTDWPGGQLTASGVPAVDYGPSNKPGPNVPAVFNQLTDCLASYNIGDCWVSERCFQPQLVLACWIFPTLLQLQAVNLRMFALTTIIGAQRDAVTGRITQVTAVQRTPIGTNVTGWEQLTSAMLEDWYSPTPSAAFSKEVITFTGMSVVIDATEFGDLLVVSNASVVQGIETPQENGTTYIDYCGQGTTIPLFMSYGMEPAPVPDPIPAGNAEGVPYTSENFTWAKIWTYRRSLALGANSSFDTVVQGEISNQNWGGGNDYDNGYLFLPLTPDVRSPWLGGVNVSALAAAEQRAFGWYHWYRNASNSSITPFLSLNKTQAGTASGLAKLPYLRDTRRSGGGLGGFRLFTKPLMNGSDPGVAPTPVDPLRPNASKATGYAFHDTIGIGQYFYADIHSMTPGSCPYPPYVVSRTPVLPYYLPFRALTVDGTPNLLVAGKLMAQSFYANAATRLHPEEWVTGAAAGAAATLMHAQSWDAQAMYDNVGQLQTLLLSLGQPLNWTLSAAPAPVPAPVPALAPVGV